MTQTGCMRICGWRLGRCASDDDAATQQEGICADSASFDLTASNLAACIEEARYTCMRYISAGTETVAAAGQQVLGGARF